MIKDGKGGANTTTGLRFEERVDIKKLLESINGYELKKAKNNSGYFIFYDGKKIARCFQKYEFYRFLSEDEYKIDWKQTSLKTIVTR